jgi:hypothetical protein
MSTDLWGKRCYVRAETELLGKVGSVKFSGAPLCWSFGRSTALRGGLRRKEKFFVSFQRRHKCLLHPVGTRKGFP